ncbi:hypothetical protein CEY16_11075 [Halalkalibacillus sediminis]|uniref:DUF192 domain-containing protein n=1 Tax=Halalkalibacillus sediminis TaxID=2018042 RepID=A0A2I0QSF0_9BACI|nr:DUF192 domain-containing protein [Halalkalibacillus sediminis]PKR77272.1 hypothetical protein CEY16_11075 [Halalkalibacillus sediminis]
MKIVNLSNNQVVGDNVQQAYTFFKRLKGLMYTKELPSGNGLHIKPCQSVHSYFMRYPIDVIYINKSQEVVALDIGLLPNKIGKRRKDAESVIEVTAGTIVDTDTAIGHQLNIIF